MALTIRKGIVRRKRSHVPRRSVLEYRQARAIQPDPVRRLASFLIAFGIVVSSLVLADAVKYMYVQEREDRAPLLVDLVELAGNLVDEDRGDQKKKEDEKEDKTEEKQEEEPTEEPPSKVKVDNEKPPGPADTDNPSKRVGIIATNAGGAPPHGLYSNRGGKAMQDALGKYGGSAKTQNAVRLGLGWLARHQDEDGKWHRTEFNKHCRRGHHCESGIDPRTQGTVLEPALTGLALLSFQGYNSTHREGEFKKNVAAGVKYLCEIQAKNGRFGSGDHRRNYYMMYNHGIATFALAELYGMTGDPSLRPYVQKAVNFIVVTQHLSGAWDYTDILTTGRYDTSVTGWQVMALKSAQAAGIEVPSYTIYRMAWFIETVTLPTGEVIYSNMFPGRGRRGQGMVAVGMASNQFLGFPCDSRLAKSQTGIILGNLPDWQKLGKRDPLNSVYYWYYATIAMFQVGGRPWEKWNTQMKKTLLLHQRRGGCREGSWDAPENSWGEMGGRIYSTTMNILNLEIYYRYLPVYSGGTLKTVEALIGTIKNRGRSDAVQAIRLLGRMDSKTGRDFLIELAHGDDHPLAMEASVALAQRRDAAAREPLLRQLRSSNQWMRYRALRAMAPMIGQGLVPVFIQALRDPKTTVSRQAAETLRQYANASFGFEPEAGLDEREAAIGKWEAWWKNHKKGAVVESSVPWLVVRVLSGKGLIAFNTGKKEATETGKKYSVYRSDKYIGRVNVVKVDGEICIGKVMEQYAAGAIKEGDVVRPGT